MNFEHLESEILEMEKNVVTNKELKFAFAQPTNWDNFSYEDNSESQEDENDSRSQVSQRQHMINKTQEVWVNEEFEDDSENGKSINEKKTKGDNQTQKYIKYKQSITCKGQNKKIWKGTVTWRSSRENGNIIRICKSTRSGSSNNASMRKSKRKRDERILKKGTSKTEKEWKNENIEDMKLEQTKKEKAIQDMLDRGMSPNKIFQ